MKWSSVYAGDFCALVRVRGSGDMREGALHYTAADLVEEARSRGIFWISLIAP